MLERRNKPMGKGYFFQAGQCPALSLFRIEEQCYFVGKGYVLTKVIEKQ